MRNRKENFLPGFKQMGEKQFGGGLLRGNPRGARPISTKRPMHLVLKSSMATGKRSFLMPERSKRIEEMIHRLGKLQGVRIYRFANSGNHLHLLVLPRSRKAFSQFVRSISGVAARLSLEKERGKARPPDSKDATTRKRSIAPKPAFWDARPFTRIVDWGREFKIAARSILDNIKEDLLFWPKSVEFSSA